MLFRGGIVTVYYYVNIYFFKILLKLYKLYKSQVKIYRVALIFIIAKTYC